MRASARAGEENGVRVKLMLRVVVNLSIGICTALVAAAHARKLKAAI